MEVTGWHQARGGDRLAPSTADSRHMFYFHEAPDTKTGEDKDAFPTAPKPSPGHVQLALCAVNSECAGGAPWHLDQVIFPWFVLSVQHVTAQGFFTQHLCHCWTDLDLK